MGQNLWEGVQFLVCKNLKLECLEKTYQGVWEWNRQTKFMYNHWQAALVKNPVRNGRDRTPKTRRMRSPEVELLKIPIDFVQYNTEHCGISDDTDDEHSVYV